MSSKKNNKNTNPASNNYRLVVLNEENYEERFALRLSKLNVLSASIAVILFLVSITTSIIFFTPIKEYIPGYDTTEMRAQAVENIRLLDSVMIILEDYQQYALALQATISGEEYNNKYQSDNNNKVEINFNDSLETESSLQKRDSLFWVKDLINTPAFDRSPEYFIEQVELITSNKDIKVDVHNKDWLQKNLFLLYVLFDL